MNELDLATWVYITQRIGDVRRMDRQMIGSRIVLGLSCGCHEKMASASVISECGLVHAFFTSQGILRDSLDEVIKVVNEGDESY